MINIVLAIVIGLALGLITAAAVTAYGLSKSNIVGEGEGAAEDFVKDRRGIVFHKKKDSKKVF